jgi:transcriptional regulator with XRE-family HTH domain
MGEYISSKTDKRSRSPRGRLPSGKPNPVDVHLGKRLRLRRILLGISQEELGKAVGLTFQQIQKYEYGVNRVGTSRLWDLSRALNCPVSFFFEDMDEQTAGASPRNLSADSADIELQHEDATSKREALMLVRAYYTIKKDSVRRRILDLANSLGTLTEEEDAEDHLAIEHIPPAVELPRSGSGIAAE